jgi:tyrosyl-tRNA synthetase
MNVIEELKWRGMIHNIMPGTEEQLNKEMTVAYIGFDPTADSLHIGNLVQIMLLKHYQKAGHKPIALVGGATGMIGDPSGKSEERNLLDEDDLRKNQQAILKQLSKFLDFDSNEENSAEMVNNYDWMKDFSFLGFLRNVGKHLTVNYMMAKDSVKNRLETGLSFTEFSYQLVQAYDFYYLNKHKNCKLQIGGSDQWGNITAGTELIRKKSENEAFAFTCPLVTKSDGGKFGKTEQGNVWLSARYTSPYQFYQFWMNISDDDAKKYIKIFTMLSREKIAEIIEEHDKAPHLRLIQKKLAREITVMVHSEEDYNSAVEVSNLLFGKGTTQALMNLSDEDLLSVFEGVPVYAVKIDDLTDGISILDLITVKADVFTSKGEARRMLKGNGVSINKTKINNPEASVTEKDLINNKYILIQKGKKNYFLLKFEK